MLRSTGCKITLCEKCRAPLFPSNNNDTTLTAPPDETLVNFKETNDNYLKVLSYVLHELRQTSSELEEMRNIVKKLF